MKKIFSKFSVEDTIKWFSERGVELNTEDDGRMFPSTNSSQTIIDCFLHEAERLGIKIWTGCDVKNIRKENDGFRLKTNHEDILCDGVIITCGGFHKAEAYNFIAETGHSVVPPVPSLFTINIHKNDVTTLMGVSVKNGEVKIAGTKFRYKGPVLITHWGFSGPAVLKLSAFAAEFLHDKNYNADVLINWSGKETEEEVKAELERTLKSKGNALPFNSNFLRLPERLWNFLLLKSEINTEKNWSEQQRKSLNKLVNHLYADTYKMEGKTTFKEEFVTCGGVDLAEVNTDTMESRIVPGLFFAGEVLNIDGITGGFNFQAAWSTAWLAAESLAQK